MTAMAGDPHRLAAAWIARRYRGRRPIGQELDDVWADCLAAVAEAHASWSEVGGRSFASWAWMVMDHRVPRERAKRSRWRQDLTDNGEVWDRRMTDAGYDRVDVADELRRIVQWCSFTEREATAARWYALHGDTFGPRLRPDPPGRSEGAWGGARKKLRAAAAARAEWWMTKNGDLDAATV